MASDTERPPARPVDSRNFSVRLGPLRLERQIGMYADHVVVGSAADDAPSYVVTELELRAFAELASRVADQLEAEGD